MCTFDSLVSESTVQKNQLFGTYSYFKFLDNYGKLRDKKSNTLFHKTVQTLKARV